MGTKDQDNPVYDMGTRVHKSYTVCVPDFGCGKSEPSRAPAVRILGTAAEDIR
jgi:hypothetical protein